MKWWPYVLAIAGFVVFILTLLDPFIPLPLAQKGMGIAALMMGVGTFSGVRLHLRYRGINRDVGGDLSWQPHGR